MRSCRQRRTSASNCWAVGTFGRINALGRLKALDQLLHFNGRSWSKVGAPNPDGNFNQLNGVTCSSSTNCFAVGRFGGDDHASNSALRWNGKRWQKVGPPNPGATANQLFGVKCTTASNCFAVGTAFTAGNPNFAELLHWNGSKWSIG